MKKVKIKIIGTILMLMMMQSSARAINNVKSLTIVLIEAEVPITDEQTVRISLWSEGIRVSGDVIAGVIDTNADNYADYQTEITETPNANGEIAIIFTDLPDFPTITLDNQYLMVEYKDSGDPITAYQVYIGECIDNIDIDRFPIMQRQHDFSRLSFSNDGTGSDNFIIDDDNSIGTGENIILQFGEALAETIKWDYNNTRFTISDDLRVEGNLAAVGQLYVAANHSTADSDGILNFGLNDSSWENLRWDNANDRFHLSDDLKIDGDIEVDAGTLRYNATLNQWEYSNDGENFSAIGSGGGLSKLFQGIDSTGEMIVTNVAQPIPLEYVSIKDDYYSHSTTVNPAEVTVLTEGWYRVHAMITVAAVSASAGTRGNPVMHIEIDSGSGFVQQLDETSGYIRENATESLSTSLSGSGFFYFNANDKIRITIYDTVPVEPDEETVAFSSRLVLAYIDRTGSSSGSVDNLKDVGDVDADAPSDGQVLTFDTVDSKWKAETPSSGGGSTIITATSDIAESNWSGNDTFSKTFAVSGAEVGDTVFATVSSSLLSAIKTANNELHVHGYVSSAGNVTVFSRTGFYQLIEASDEWQVSVLQD